MRPYNERKLRQDVKRSIGIMDDHRLREIYRKLIVKINQLGAKYPYDERKTGQPMPGDEQKERVHLIMESIEGYFNEKGMDI